MITKPDSIYQPFCNNGVEGIDYTLPPDSGADTSIVSQPFGAPEIMEEPISAGGLPLLRKQFNGVLRKYSDILLWMNAGGQFTFDNTIATNTGGYPKDTILFCASNQTFQRSLINNNVANFVTNPAYINDGINWAQQGNNAANQVTAKLTPIFATGEQYVLSVSFEGSVTQTIVLNRRYVDGTSVGTGTDFVELQLTRNKAQGHGSVGIKVIATSLPITSFGFKAYYLNAGSVTISGVIIPALQVIFTMYLKTSIQNTNTINNVFGDYLSASQEFIQKATQYPILFEPVADGAITGSAVDVAFTTNATVNQLQDISIDISVKTVTANNGVQSLGAGLGSSGYGFSCNTPKGIYAPNGESIFNQLISRGRTELSNGTGLTSSVVVFSNPGARPASSYVGSDGTTGASGGFNGIIFDSAAARPQLNNSAVTTGDASNTIAILDDIAANGVGIVASGNVSGVYWVKFANGLIIQGWGSYFAVSGGGTSIYIPFPIQFVGTPLVIPVNKNIPTPKALSWMADSISATIYCGTTDFSGSYLAIGY